MKIWTLIRAHEWWNYKIPPALGLAYAFAWSESVPFSKLIMPTILIVLAGFSAGIFASVFNDFMDLEQDKLAGKSTPMMTLKPWQRLTVIALSLFLDSIVAIFLFHLPISFSCFILIWLLYTAYSLPPIRLKEKGVFGIVCIAIGEHVLATLISLFIVSELTGAKVSTTFIIASSIWSLCFGCRGILWHQLSDIENDRIAACRTMGAELGYKALQRFGEFFIFPMEILAFSILFFLCFNPLACLFLILHAILEYLRIRYMQAKIIIVEPLPNARFVFFEYYQILFPLAFLFSAVKQDASSVFLVALFCLFFAKPIALSLQHIRHFIYWLFINPNLEALRSLLSSTAKTES